MALPAARAAGGGRTTGAGRLDRAPVSLCIALVAGVACSRACHARRCFRKNATLQRDMAAPGPPADALPDFSRPVDDAEMPGHAVQVWRLLGQGRRRAAGGGSGAGGGPL